jgi:uncharacterized membrane protein YjjP (DUF1212 family)
MDIAVLILLTLTFSILFLVIQRAERRRRLVVAIIMGFVGLLVQRYANYRALHSEALIAFILAIIFNLLFWIILGRYNPPGSSDDIQVLGMDD